MRNIFPLQSNVPYKTREGERVVLGPNTLLGVMFGSNGQCYHAVSGRMFPDRDRPTDIMDLFIEPALWRLRNGRVVGIRPRENVVEGDRYPIIAYDPDSNDTLYSLTADGYYYHESSDSLEWDIASYVSEAVGIAIPDDGFLQEGYWLRANGSVTKLVYYVAQGVFSDRHTTYPLNSLGRVSPETRTIKDLVRPLTEAEAHDIQSKGQTKNFVDFLDDGLLLHEDEYCLSVIPAAWLPMMREWVELVRNNRAINMARVRSKQTIADMRTYQDTVSFRVEQRFLFDKYKVQIGDTYLMDSEFVRDKTYPTARATEHGVEIIYTPRSFIHGGTYFNNNLAFPDLPEPQFHTSPYDLRGYNSPRMRRVGYTYNQTTNWKVAVHNYVEQKIAFGEYEQVPSEFPVKWGSGAHISTQNPNLLAYFPTFGHYQRKVPQQIKPGRYLKQFWPDMHDDKVRRLSALFGAGELKFYSRWQDMLAAYRELDNAGIVSSCMSKDNWGLLHPLMVYDNSDVELAVLYVGEQPVARALYNKQNKCFPMVYGQWEKMEVAMRNAGFIHDSLCGAHIRRLPARLDTYRMENDGINRDTLNLDDLDKYDNDPDTILMPYIDHRRELDRSSNCSTNVDVYDKYCVIDYDGAVEANDHEYARVSVEGSRGSRVECESCNHLVHQDDTYYVEYNEINVCQYCYEHHVVEVHNGSRSSFTAMESTAEHRFVYVEPAGRWYEDVSTAHEAGYCWSEHDNEYYRDTDCVWVTDMDDYIHESDIGTICQYDEDEGEYVSMDEYNSRMAEREQQQAA